MNGRAHLIGGFISMVPAYLLNDPGVLLIPGCILGSVLPDIDADYSTFNHWCPKVSKIYKLLPKNPWTKHRGALFHSVFTILVIFVAFLYWNPSGLMSGLLWGVLSHHVLDLMTPQGLDYLYPIRRKKK